ncbi:hypothetical protein [Mesorhizobium sp. WSM4906]|uniref:hypothetical protein n=1 Tax=Mesorhizobium sp. WSM4906 TaxID=3038546 RepID=UPI00241671B3|nr:hypothetical protein [Mesorhizobium sp. WSM4906]WFP76564.1 hypothetical protein QAZ22_01550 [Mesorhizobium sp. WSM4906]
MTTFPSDESQHRLVEEFKTAARSMTVGFMKLRRQGEAVEDADPSGTGTLVRVGKVAGILTASHVLDQLAKSGQVGLMRITDRPDQPQKVKMEMDQTERLTFGRHPFGALGPDLSFLRLPEDLAGWLDAMNGFLNLEMRRTRMLASPDAEPYNDALIGVIAERTRKLAGSEQDPVVETSSLITSGKVVATLLAHGLDVLHFRDSLPPEKRPGSYQGTSGGGLWRMYLGADLHSVRDRCLVGVAFYEFKDDGRMTVVCHGPEAIYGAMVNAIRQKWPGAA